MNCGDGEFTAHFDAQAGCGIDLITGDSVDFGGGTYDPRKNSNDNSNRRGIPSLTFMLKTYKIK